MYCLLVYMRTHLIYIHFRLDNLFWYYDFSISIRTVFEIKIFLPLGGAMMELSNICYKAMYCISYNKKGR